MESEQNRSLGMEEEKRDNKIERSKVRGDLEAKGIIEETRNGASVLKEKEKGGQSSRSESKSSSSKSRSSSNSKESAYRHEPK